MPVVFNLETVRELDPSLINPDEEVRAYTLVGFYPIAYVTADSEYLCAACVNGGNGSRAHEQLDSTDKDDDAWRVIGVNIEEAPDDTVRCAHCHTIIARPED